MFENAKWIRAKTVADNAPQYYFCDLNIIYPLKKATLHITAGGVYGANGEYFLRMNVACPRKLLLDGLERLCAGVNAYLMRK